jgi:hypothetical protein
MKKTPLKAAHYTCSLEHDAVLRLDTHDPEAFIAHVKTFHGGGRRVRAAGLPKPKPAGYAPRQTKPFAPEGLQVGADITWREAVPTGDMRRVGDFGDHREVPVTEWVERTGQIWSLGGYPRSAWVIPYDEIPDEAELAVLVGERRYVLPGEPAFEQMQTYRSEGRRAA